MNTYIYDLVIIGGGPAGLAAALYGGRALFDTAVIEGMMAGGQILLTNEIVNYPGVIAGESGYSLMQRFEASAKSFGAVFFNDIINEVDFSNRIKLLRGAKDEYRAMAVILATGARAKLLQVPGEKEFTGRGVSYCATCDGAFFKEKEVFVVGGGDAAVEEAVYLTKFASKVTLIHRRDQLRASRNIQEKAFDNSKISFLWDSAITEMTGDNLLRALSVKNLKTGEERVMTSSVPGDNIGVFIFIGYEPNNALFSEVVALDETGFVLTDERMRTNVSGIFAAGDIRSKSLRQVVTAAADGAVAAVEAAKYIEETFDK